MPIISHNWPDLSTEKSAIFPKDNYDNIFKIRNWRYLTEVQSVTNNLMVGFVPVLFHISLNIIKKRCCCFKKNVGD